jgi:phage shock protein A
MSKYQVDELEDRITLLRHNVKELRATVENLRKEIDELRKIMNALAHATALLQDKKTPLWVHEYYRKWEKKQKDWFDV